MDICVFTTSGERIEMDPPVVQDDHVEDLRSRVAKAIQVHVRKVVLLSNNAEMADGHSLKECMGGRDGPCTVSVIKQPCCIRPHEYEDYINRDTTGFLKVNHIRYDFGHPLKYDDGWQGGFRWDDVKGYPDPNGEPYFFRGTQRGVAEFPEPTGININMMPFILGDKDSIPAQYQHYWPMIQQCCIDKSELKNVGYLTIQESVVSAGESQRRQGLHIESPGSLTVSGTFTDERIDWGCGIVRADLSRVEGGIYMASNVPHSCKLYNVKIRDPPAAAGPLGCMEHMRELLGEGVEMEAGTIYWLTDATPHESLPLESTTPRQFFRVVSSALSAWYPAHSTKNDLVQIDETVTQIVKGNKFEFPASQPATQPATSHPSQPGAQPHSQPAQTTSQPHSEPASQPAIKPPSQPHSQPASLGSSLAMAAGARELVQKAEGKLKGGFLSMFTGGPSYDEASDLYMQAANQFKLAKEWQDAASCFEQCAFCAQKSGSATDQANYIMEAGNVLKKVSTAQASEKYEQAIAIFSVNGRFQQSGKLLMTIAELYEGEGLQHKETTDFYKRAAEMFELDDHGKSNFTKCNLKVAEYAAKDGDYDEAIRIFESEGEKALQNTLPQYSAKDNFLRAGILHLVVGDIVTVNIAADKYRCLDPRFGSSREGELLQGLAEAFENKDVDDFVAKLADYDSMSKLDAWKIEFLVKVKDSMTGGDGGMGGIDLA